MLQIESIFLAVESDSQELGQAHFLYQFHIYIIYCCKLSEAMIGPKNFPSKIKKKNCTKFVPPPSPFLKVEINGTCTKIGSYSISLKKLQRWTQFFRGGGLGSEQCNFLFVCVHWSSYFIFDI